MHILIGMLAHTLDSEVVRRVHTQAWDSYDVLTLWGRDMRPGEHRFQAITRKYQELQRIFLSGPWDALLTVEQDMLIPNDALQNLAQLLEDGADVAYGLYVWRYEEQHWWSAHPQLRQAGDGLLNFSSMTHYPEQARKHWGDVLRVEGLGLGCTLISRLTMVMLGFRQIRPDHCCDTALALDCQDAELIQVCDTSVVCGHQLGGGRVIWPDPASDTLYRMEKV